MWWWWSDIHATRSVACAERGATWASVGLGQMPLTPQASQVSIHASARNENQSSIEKMLVKWKLDGLHSTGSFFFVARFPLTAKPVCATRRKEGRPPRLERLACLELPLKAHCQIIEAISSRVYTYKSFQCQSIDTNGRAFTSRWILYPITDFLYFVSANPCCSTYSSSLLLFTSPGY